MSTALLSTAGSTPPVSEGVSRQDVLTELAPFAKAENLKGILLVLQEFAIYWACIASVVFVPSMTIKILASLVAGFKLTAFYTLGHDAGHHSLVKNKKLNWWLAQALAIPSWQNHKLWILDHHLLHHPKTNGAQYDFYQPYSKQQYDSLSSFWQLYERLVRAPNLIGFGINFCCRWWITTRIAPGSSTPKKHFASAFGHFISIVVYQVAFLGLLIISPRFGSITVTTAILLGFVLPLVVFALVTGASLYLMHTHERLPWFNGPVARHGDYAPELCAMHMTLPDPLHKFIHNVFAHSAHHAHPGIPPYKLLDAQKHFDALMGPKALVIPMTLKGAISTMNKCKLYNFEQHQWLDFNGKPTTPRIDLSMRGA